MNHFFAAISNGDRFEPVIPSDPQTSENSALANTSSSDPGFLLATGKHVPEADDIIFLLGVRDDDLDVPQAEWEINSAIGRLENMRDVTAELGWSDLHTLNNIDDLILLATMGYGNGATHLVCA